VATIVQDIMTEIDLAVGSFAETIFGDLADPLTITIQLGGVMGLALLAANALMQWSPMRMSQYLAWSVRFVAILSVATTWTQFDPIYQILTNVPGSIGGAMLSDIGAPTLNAAMDDMVTEIFNYGDRAEAEAAWYEISLVSVLLKLLGALIAAVAIIVLAAAKIGLAFAVATAPIFIAALLFGFSADLFKSWARFTIGFALIPLVLAGVMGAILFVGSEIVNTARGGPALEDALQLIVISIVSVFMMMQVPTMVNGLAGGIVATATGFAEARQAATAAMRTASGGYRGARDAGDAAGSASNTVRSFGAAVANRDEGQSATDAFIREAVRRGEVRRAGIAADQARQTKLGNEPDWRDRRDAGRAAVAQYKRDNIAGRVKDKPS
jgi:type IV secretion system protein VirB6